MAEWIRFWVTAVLLAAALLSFASAVIGVCRFGFVMNRMHAAGIGDTLGLFCVIAACVVSSASLMEALKLILLIVFMWFTSPVSTHFLGQVEYLTNPRISEEIPHSVTIGSAAAPADSDASSDTAASGSDAAENGDNAPGGSASSRNGEGGGA